MKTRTLVFLVLILVIVGFGCVRDTDTALVVTPTEEVATAVESQAPSPTETPPLPTNTPTLEPSTPTPRPTNTPVPTPTPVYSDPDLGYPYFIGEEVVDVLAMSKAVCIEDLRTHYPERITSVMEAEDVSEVEAINQICSMPVVACEQIPNPYVRLPILDLGEVWEEGLVSSSFADGYEEVPTDEFVPGTDYCFMGLGQQLTMYPDEERLSLCPDPAWERIGIPSQEADCMLAVFEVTTPEYAFNSYSGRYSGYYYLFSAFSNDPELDLIWDYFVGKSDSFAGSVGRKNKDFYLLDSIFDFYSDPGDWIVFFEVPYGSYLNSLDWAAVTYVDPGD